MTTGTDLNHQLAAGEAVVPFSGTVHCHEPVRFGPRHGQRLEGDGPQARLMFYFDGNSAGPACVNFAHHYQGLHNCEVLLQRQITAISRETLAPRPTAIDLHGFSRAAISNVTIHNATEGIKALGNCGGLTLSHVEIGAVGTALHIDGALDTVTMIGCRVWPHGHVSVQHGLAIYSDGRTVAARFGRVDDLSITNMTAFRAGVRFEPDAKGMAAFGHIGNLRLDGSYANLVFDAGDMTIGFLGSTSAAVDDYVVRQTGGQLIVSKSDMELPNSSVPAIRHQGGHGTYHGGHIAIGASADTQALRQEGGRLVMAGMEFPVSPAKNRTTPIIDLREGAFFGRDLLAGQRSTGSGTFILARRKMRGSIRDCDSAGWGWDMRGQGMQARGNLGPGAPDDVIDRIEALERAVSRA